MEWDILFYKKILLSHILDAATRWAVASVIKDKTPEAIIEAITTHWLRL